MKKGMVVIILMIILCSLFAGCANPSANSMDVIKPMELSQEQKDVVELLSSDKQEILLFTYATKEAYKYVELWVEVYENGILVDRPAGAGFHGDEAKLRNGTLAITINPNPHFQWTITTSEDGTRTTQSGELKNTEYTTSGRAFGPIDEAVSIQGGQEIVLYSSIFSDEGISVYSGQQIYIEQPELLQQYPYVHLIK